jgi:hypothetical protein
MMRHDLFTSEFGALASTGMMPVTTTFSNVMVHHSHATPNGQNYLAQTRSGRQALKNEDLRDEIFV